MIDFWRKEIDSNNGGDLGDFIRFLSRNVAVREDHEN